MWMVRNNGGDYAEEFKDQNIVAVGWKDAGSLKGLTREQIINRVRETWPNYKIRKAGMSGSQLDKIVNVMKIGDRVITYDPSKRIYSVGRIIGEYEHDTNGEDILANRRSVKWENEIERDRLSVPTKNSLGSTLTIFEVPKIAEKEIDALIKGEKIEDKLGLELESESDLDVKSMLDEIQSKAKEFIKDRIVRLEWDELQELVAGVLRAMGYKTRVSPRGSDRGKDIVASPDGFGFEQPRIVVEVKHRPNHQIGSADIRSYLGGRHKDDRGLYVSTGGFSKDAKYEAERASIPLTLMDIDELVEAVIENYERMDLDARTILPLNKFYWPNADQ
jgi:restriction system protein